MHYNVMITYHPNPCVRLCVLAAHDLWRALESTNLFGINERFVFHNWLILRVPLVRGRCCGNRSSRWHGRVAIVC